MMTQDEYEIDDCARAELKHCYEMAQKWHGIWLALFRLRVLVYNDITVDDEMRAWVNETWNDACDNYTAWTIRAGLEPYGIGMSDIPREYVEWPQFTSTR
jgi:hypothetical protein